MSKKSYWIIGIGSLLSIIAICTPIFFYIKDFHQLNRSTTPSDWGTFGDFIGGITNPIISFLTLIVTIIIAVNLNKIENRNHEETVHNQVKPIFTIESTEFYSADVSRFSFPVGKNFYSYNPPEKHAEQYDYMSNPFYLKIHNKGLGIATKVQTTFTINLKELRELLKFENSEIKVVVSDIGVRDDGKKFINVHFNHAEYKSYCL
ncbi:hypothetical protein [Chryseobacterium taichungense]|uniref:hypothetical protein n=1 Tax=Chryseobacterium taichungense TaxID=295069 RepID=UPI0028B1FF21|nr:hypothetical protein [Chryseobacterium taichungense]